MNGLELGVACRAPPASSYHRWKVVHGVIRLHPPRVLFLLRRLLAPSHLCGGAMREQFVTGSHSSPWPFLPRVRGHRSLRGGRISRRSTCPFYTWPNPIS